MICLGSDHKGFEYKQQAQLFFAANNEEVTDYGAVQVYPNDDYPDYAFKVAQAVGQGLGEGILFCESAGGMTICANKVRGVRAVACSTPQAVKHAKEHNNANVLCIGTMDVPADKLAILLKTWLETKFTNEPRHARRITKIAVFEENYLKEV